MSEDAGPFLTVPEIARRLGVSETTAHNWRRTLADLIPARTGRDGYERYALRRYEEVAALRKQRLPLSAIRTVLRERVPISGTPPAPTTEERLLVLLERLTVAVERIADHLDPPKEG